MHPPRRQNHGSSHAECDLNYIFDAAGTICLPKTVNHHTALLKYQQQYGEFLRKHCAQDEYVTASKIDRDNVAISLTSVRDKTGPWSRCMLHVAKRKATRTKSPTMSLLEFFYPVDTFCQAFLPQWDHELPQHGQWMRRRSGQ